MGVTYTTATGATYVPIATYTATGSISSYTFSSISGSYTDLILETSLNDANGYALVRLNGDSGTNYSRTYLYGTGSTVTSSSQTSLTSTYIGGSSTASVFGGTHLHFFNYSNSTTYKTILSRQFDNLYTWVSVNLWRATPAAINSIAIISANGTASINAGSTFSLYGILGA